MRWPAFLCLLPVPALGWTFSPDPICTLSHQAETAAITITYDASLPEYALSIALRDATWSPSPSFRITFGGGREITIGTTQHRLSADGSTLTVRDRGFGNVLDGIEFNSAFLATNGREGVTMNTRNAAPAVQAFRACPISEPATS